MRVFDPTQSAVILRTIQDIEAGNNGWSFIPSHAWLHEALTAAGYAVLASLDFHPESS